MPIRVNPFTGDLYPDNGGTWGSITGTLSDQTDLQTALDAKVAKAGDTMTGTLTVPNITVSSGIDATTTMNFRRAGSTVLTYNSARFAPQNNLAYDLGASTLYFSGTYSQRYYLNSTAYLDGATAGVITPTGSFATTKFVNGAAIELYNTADQTTNYERVRQYWNSNVFTISSEIGGTGTSRNINIRTTSTQFLIRETTNAEGFYQFPRGSSTPGVNGVVVNSVWGTTSGTNAVMAIVPTISQTTTAGYTALLINPTETTTGSGAKNLIDAQVGGTSKFKVSNTGDAEITTATSGVILKSPDGSRFRITVGDDGSLTTTEI